MKTFREEKIEIGKEGRIIRGIALIPEAGQKRYPAILCAHGLTETHTACMDFAERMAELGILSVCFDFRGGAENSLSDGRVTEMSLMTEALDVKTALSEVRSWEQVDPERILLYGTSQGAAASAIAAARCQENVNGLILCCPALLIPDMAHELYASLEKVPDTFFFKWLTLGRPFIEDVWELDIYEEISRYRKPVLLMHGDHDHLVPVSYSERAAEAYRDVEFKVIHGGGHTFPVTHKEEVLRNVSAYLRRIGIIEAQ